jgi:hypothetical protein
MATLRDRPASLVGTRVGIVPSAVAGAVCQHREGRGYEPVSMAGGPGILADMTWFPGLRQCSAVRQLRLPADAGQVRERLTDSDRREREWRRQVEQREDIREPHVGRLPNGRLRCRYEWVQGRLVWRFTTEDAAVTENMIERVHRGELARPRVMPVRWVISERISIETGINATCITVCVLGRMAGLSRVLHLLGYRDTATARRLAELARLQADLTTSAIAAHFARPPDLAAGADSAR